MMSSHQRRLSCKVWRYVTFLEHLFRTRPLSEIGSVPSDCEATVTGDWVKPAVNAEEALTDCVDALLPQRNARVADITAVPTPKRLRQERSTDVRPAVRKPSSRLRHSPDVRFNLDAACGAYGPPNVARIDEAACIGCTLCIAACPVDAIIGAAANACSAAIALYRLRALRSVLPVDCIAIEPLITNGRIAIPWRANASLHAISGLRAANGSHTSRAPIVHPVMSTTYRRQTSVAAAFARQGTESSRETRFAMMATRAANTDTYCTPSLNVTTSMPLPQTAIL